MRQMRVVQDAGLLARLRARRQAEGAAAGRIVAIHGARAGAGASTLAASLALLWARVAGPVLLLDLALGGADQDLFWQVTPQHRLDEVLSGAVPVSEAWTGLPGGVRLMLGMREPDRGLEPDPHAIERLLDWLASRHPVVVVDTSAGTCEVNRTILARAERVLVPVPAEMGHLRSARSLPARWAARGLASDRFSFLLFRRPAGPERELAARILDRPLDGVFPWLPDAAGEALERGEPLIRTRSGRSYMAALEAMAGQLWPESGLRDGERRGLSWWSAIRSGGLRS
ncbi:MAG: hypothetical protein VKO64_09185 [Candidatus Sericytochromatia bacterium]|nr:hypothetical protein [Candidatus Sericytochromatia bacterium]